MSEPRKPPPISRQRKWQSEQCEAGNCITCGKKRGKTGTQIECGTCAEKRRAWNRAYYWRIRGTE